MTIRVKICGITNVDDARLAVEAGADLIGLNFYSPSPRYVSEPTARAICDLLPPSVWRVGVFVNAPRHQVAALAERLGLDAVQFHGDETVSDCRGWQQKTIKALRVGAEPLLPDWSTHPADYVLLDTYRPGRYGGTGTSFVWSRLAGLPEDQRQRLILAGGLTPENVTTAIRTVQPWAVDVASGVERAPGHKDADKLRAFIQYAKTA